MRERICRERDGVDNQRKSEGERGNECLEREIKFGVRGKGVRIC